MSEQNKENIVKKDDKTLEERVDFLENQVRVLTNRLESFSRRMNSSERSTRNQVDLY